MQPLLPMKAKLLTLGLALGLAGSTFGAGYAPVPLTPSSFTFDIVVESNYLAPAAVCVTATMDNGPTLSAAPVSMLNGNTWYERGANRTAGNTTTGLPPAGSLVTNQFQANHVYQMPPTYIGYNNVFIGNYTNVPVGFTQGYTNGAFTITAPATYTNLSFLSAAGNGPVVMTCNVMHQDGTSELSTISSLDWFAGNNTNTPADGHPCVFAVAPNARVSVSQNSGFNVTGSTGCRLWATDLPVTNTASAVTNITFTFVSGGRCCIFAVSGDAGTGSGCQPIAVTGYDADSVIEKDPGALPYNATMDNGTNIASGGFGANTFFEIGWDPVHPTNGFPFHNTIYVSTNTGRPYQMAPTYAGPMSALVDTNHQVVNLTLQTSASFTAFSLLTAGGNIQAGNIMTNFVVLQHDDGSNETNFFGARDWFDNSAGGLAACAYSCNGRTSFNGLRNLNADPNGSGDPKIYESQFILQNTRSPVTNLVLLFGRIPTASGTPFATTFVLAVSATAGGIPLILNTNTLAQNVYAGGNASFVANITAGIDRNSIPIFHWQYSATEYGAYANLTDGVNGVGGSGTSNLTITAVSGANVGFYQCVITNTVSTNITAGSPLTLLVSTAANISQPGDPISEFGSLVADPAGQGVTGVVDGTLVKWLNHGVNGGAPFLGPVGYITTPNAGNSIITAMRFVVASDVPGRDPVDYQLEGSNDGVNYATISSGALTLPDTRNENLADPIDLTDQVLQEVDFANSAGYYTYRVTFQNVKTNAAPGVDSLQISEVQMLGSLTPLPPGILVQPNGSQKLFVGESFSATVTVNGPSPYFYHWFNGVNPVPGQTSATLSLNNVQISDSGTYSCSISNSFGATNSTGVSLTVLPRPAGYASTILADNPIAFWRLDEGPDNGSGNTGTIANDYVGSHDGVYTNAELSLAGYSVFDSDTAAGFGVLNTSASFVGGISGINFVNPTNLNTGAFSIEAWVQSSSAQAVAGAGIVCSGLSGGGEQFALDCGGNAPNGFRFYFRDATGGAHNAVGANPTTGTNGTGDTLWHHLVGVVDEVNSNEFLYIDGLPVSQIPLGANLGVLNVQAPTNPFTIGTRSVGLNGNPTNLTMNFSGEIDEVAVYNTALSAAQVQAHYFAAGIVPVLLKQPATITASEGGSATFTSQGYGSPNLSYQWWNSDQANPTTPLSGQTSSNLTFNGLTVSQDSTFYQLVVTNTFGAVTSRVVELFVVSGPPQTLPNGDLNPFYVVYAGNTLVLPTTTGGSQPITYGWSFNGSPIANSGRLSGATSNVLTIANAQVSDSGTYQLFMTNSRGTGQSVAAAVTVLPVLTFDYLGYGWTQNGGTNLFNGSNSVALTDNGGGEARSVWFASPVYVGGFIASFTYQDVNLGGADGITFCVQNDPRGAAAVGSSGGGLGYGISGNAGTPISPSVAFAINLYTDGNGPGVALTEDGNTGSTGGTLTYTTPGAIVLGSGDPISVALKYLNGSVSLTMTDAVSSASFAATIPVNVPAVLGTNSAFVGFTGGTGGVTSSQTVSNFTFISLVPLSVAKSGGGNITFSWPVETGGYQLQSNTAINNPGGWTTLTNIPSIVGGQNQIVLPASLGAGKYFRLVNP
jgi:hypothetical protein